MYNHARKEQNGKGENTMSLHSISFLGLERLFQERDPKMMKDNDYAMYFWSLSF